MRFALPDYLTRNARFDDCPPGHRFGLYFDGWSDSFGLPKDGKTDAFRRTINLPKHSRDALAALCARQRSLAAALGETVLTYPARLSAPLATGLGNEHPLENGFAFLNPHGLPYLAGSGVKGVIRRAAEELASGEWGEREGWTEDAIRLLFGPGEDDPERDSHARRGALMFWDLFFKPANDKSALLAVEIMTPHHSGYLQGSGSPHANESPNPISFLAIAAGCECTVHVQCNPALIPAQAAGLRETWQALVEAAIALAAEWLGFGAKTAVGYGRLALGEPIRPEPTQPPDTRTPQVRAIAEFGDACKSVSGRKDPLNPGSGLYAKALQLSKQALEADSGWSPEDRLKLADALAEWLPKVVEKLDRKDDWKDARKRLKLAALRGE